MIEEIIGVVLASHKCVCSSVETVNWVFVEVEKNSLFWGSFGFQPCDSRLILQPTTFHKMSNASYLEKVVVSDVTAQSSSCKLWNVFLSLLMMPSYFPQFQTTTHMCTLRNCRCYIWMALVWARKMQTSFFEFDLALCDLLSWGSGYRTLYWILDTRDTTLKTLVACSAHIGAWKRPSNWLLPK